MPNATIEGVMPKSGSATAQHPEKGVDADVGAARAQVAEEEGDEIHQDEPEPDRRDQIDIAEQPYSGSDEEEGHVGEKKIPRLVKMTLFDHTEEEGQQGKHHPDDRTGDRKLKALAQHVTGEGEGENDSKLKEWIHTATLL